VKWDPGAKAKQGMDCFSIASAFTPSEIRARDGSVKLVVGGDAKVYASLLSAADDIIVEAKGLIKAEAKGESYLSNVSIQNGRRNRTIRQESDIIIQKVQLVAGGNVRMIAHKNVDIKGGDIVAGLEVEMVGENINLTPIQLIAENKVKEYGSQGFSYYKNKMTYSTSNVATTDIHANSIKLAAKHDVNITASILMAMEDININAGNNITIVEELVEHYVNSSHFGAHLNFFGKKAMERVLNNDLKKAERCFNKVKNDLISEFGTIDQINRLIKARNMPDALCEGAKAIMDLYKEFKAYEAAGSLKNYAINNIVEKVGQARISAEFSNEKKQWVEAILPVMKAKNIIMKAGNHIKLRGLQAKAETMSLEAKGNIDIQAAQEYYNQHQRRRDIGLRAQANYDHGGKGFMKPTIGISAGYSSSSNESVKNLNAHIDVQTFTAKTPNTLTLEGANIVAKDVKIQAHALLMKSLTDTENGRNKSISGGIDLNLATGQLSGHVEGSKGSYNCAKVNEQTGITALGEFIAEIGDVTHLQGAFIDATNGVLQSKRFIHEDMQEHDQNKQIGFGIGCFDFSRNSAFIMPDIKYASRNQKGVLKAGVSSGVQIVTQSDISTLNRDLSRAREIVKDHKHYVRVVVPIPTGMEKAKNALEAVGQDLRSAFDYLCNNRNAAVDPIPQFVKNEIKEDLEAHEYINNREDLSGDEKDYLWHYYKAVKQAERYGAGYLSGKDFNGHNRYGEVKIVNGTVEINYTVYEKEVFAEKLAERIMLEAGKDNNEANRQTILPIIRDLLDEYNDKYKNRALTADLLQDVHEFRLYYGMHAGDDETPDAYSIRKVALPLAIPAGVAAWEGMCFLGGAIAGWFGWQQTKEYLKENNYVDDDENPVIMHGNGPIAESFPAHTQDGPNIMWTPAHDERGLQTLVTPEHNLGLRVEGLPIADPLPKLGGFDIYNGPKLNVFEVRKPKEEGDQVHHVIPQNKEDYIEFWKRIKLHDQDECNLLDLPGKEKAIREKSKKAIHQGRHDKDYHDEIKREVEQLLVKGKRENWSQKKFTQEGQKLLDKCLVPTTYGLGYD
jgi:hypothetical protein